MGADAAVRSYATPRRLAVVVSGVSERQQDATEQLTGPSWKVAFKDDQPTPAAHAFARKAGVAVDALVKQTTPKGEYVSATVTRAGRSAAEILAEKLPEELAKIYWAKSMYWRAGEAGALCAAGAVDACAAGWRVVPVEFGGKMARQRQLWTSRAAWRCAGHDRYARGVCGEAGGSLCGRRCERAAGAHSQGAGPRDPHRGRRTLARR